ncbi:MAG TPA: CHAT domain-containing protein [Oculatellaceae cyanobacterium]|jgi:hypothetical protein
MSAFENPCLTVAIDRLTYGRLNFDASIQAEHFAIWVLKAPCPGAYVHSDRNWTENLTQAWLAWQEMFNLRGLPHVPLVHHITGEMRGKPAWTLPPQPNAAATAPMPSYGSRLMQHLGISLWEWVFDGSIENSFAQSEGIAIGQTKPLRVRLEIRDPDLIPLPWEIMQPQAGKPAISLSQHLLFSRTTSDVYPLQPVKTEQALNILLVLGQETAPESSSGGGLKLEQEANVLAKVLGNGTAPAYNANAVNAAPCHVDVLVQPTPTELIKALETENYNIFFYAGHGVPAPDGGLLFLSPDSTLNGTELAQVLVRCQVKLAVFNACWGAQPDQDNYKAIPRSSLAEVLIHHGVPAVLGMRDSIADEEALTFIQSFAQALVQRMPIDQAVAVSRQQLLTIYKFNQPAWTLPVLYMHPEFDGVLLNPIGEGITELPGIPLKLLGESTPIASLRSLEEIGKIWQIRGTRMRVGRSQDNDLVIEKPEVSRKHAEIIVRDAFSSNQVQYQYFLRDQSSFGTFLLTGNGWQKVHHQEVILESGAKLKFGSTESQTMEFIIDWKL